MIVVGAVAEKAGSFRLKGRARSVENRENIYLYTVSTDLITIC